MPERNEHGFVVHKSRPPTPTDEVVEAEEQPIQVEDGDES